jgi:hypothetical protein
MRDKAPHPSFISFPSYFLLSYADRARGEDAGGRVIDSPNQNCDSDANGAEGSAVWKVR